jgi:hypothetical protein
MVINLLPCLLGFVPSRAAEPTPGDVRPWYWRLRPGVTRSEIQRLGGLTLPAGDKVEVDAGNLGRFEFEFRDDVLHRGVLVAGAPGAGAVFYGTYSGPTAVNWEARRTFLKAGNYAIVSRFTGPAIRTLKYDGYCYEVDGQYLVIEPIIGPGTGHFANKAARVLLLSPDGTEKTLYRAIDHWNDLRPPELSRSAATRREGELRRLGTRAIGLKVGDVLGPADSRMGSGIDYRVYYLPRGLAIVHVGSRAGTPDPVATPPDFIVGMRIVVPGSDRPSVRFEDWLKSAGAAP